MSILVHLAVVRQLANNRQGTQKAKTRSEVSAAAEENHGDRKEQVMQDRVPSVLHSGQAAELYSLQFQEIIAVKMNKKERRAALKSALTSKVQENKFVVVDEPYTC